MGDEKIDVLAKTSRESHGPNLIVKREEVLETNDPIARILYLLFYRMGMTHDEFTRRHSNFWLDMGSKSREAINTDRNNILGAIRKALKVSMTWSYFYHILTMPMGFTLVKLSMKIKDNKTGQVYVINHTDKPDDPLIGVEPTTGDEGV